MNLVLQVLSGEKEGQRVPIRAGQVVSFGRTNAADYSFEDDGHMSSLHFEVEHQGDTAQIRDRNSRNGTWINGDRISMAMLEDGQLIKAGHTTLQVILEQSVVVPRRSSDVESPEFDQPIATDEIAPTVEIPPGSSHPARHDPWDTDIPPAAKVDRKPAISQEKLPETVPIPLPLKPSLQPSRAFSPFESANFPIESPVIRHHARAVEANSVTRPKGVDNPFGSDSFSPADFLGPGGNVLPSRDEQPGMVESDVEYLQKVYHDESVEATLRIVVSALQQRLSMVAVAHFQKIRMTTPPELTNAQPLLDWLPQPISRERGPVLLDYSAWETIAERQLMIRLCRADALIVFFGSNQQAVMSQIKEMMRTEIYGFSEAEGFLGCCWPSTFSALKDSSDRSAYSKLFGKSLCGAILCPPQRPMELAAYAKSALANDLKEYGFTGKRF